MKTRFAVESNFAMSAGDAYTHHYFDRNREVGRFKLVASLAGKRMIGLRDDWRKFSLMLNWKERTKLWLFPIYSVSQSESGFERIFQAAVVMPIFSLNLAAGECWSTEFNLEVIT